MTGDHTVKLLVNNKNYAGWKAVRVTAGLQRAARDFSLSVSERFPGQDHPLRITPGDSCQILIGHEVIVTGYVDSVSISHSATDHHVTVAGRSKTQDLIDCGVQPPWTDMENLTLVQIANTLAEPYGVDIVDALGSATDTIPELGVTPGSTVFSVIEQAARIKASLVTDDAQGRLLLTRAGIQQAASSLKLGEHILSGSATFDHKERFSHYEVRGQHKGSDQLQGAVVTKPKAVVEDQTVRRIRKKYVTAERMVDGQRVQERARWEAAVSAGKSTQATLTVQGWRQQDGTLWAPNTLVMVEDALLTIKRSLLIVEVTFSLSDRGTLTTLTLAPREAYELIPEDPAGSTQGIGAWKEFEAWKELKEG